MVEMDLVYSPNDMARLLKQPVSWDVEEDRSIELAEYISTRLPEVAASLGVDNIRAGMQVMGPDELTDKEQRKLTLSLLEYEGPKNWALAIGKGIYRYREIVDAVRHNTGFGPEYVRMSIRGRGSFLRLVEAGKLKIDPNKPDIELSFPPKPSEFSF